MWEFISQNWWIFIFVGMMFFMHRSGAGCCGGSHEGEQRKAIRVKVPEDENFKRS